MAQETMPLQLKTNAQDRVANLRVLHVVAIASGANWMVDILRGLKGRGYEVSALINNEQGDLAPKLERNGIPYHVADFNLSDLFSNPLTFANKLLKLTRFFRKHRFDIIHYHHIAASVVPGRIAAWVSDAPIRYSMTPHPLHLEVSTLSKIDRRTQWMDTKIIATCEYTRQLYYKLGIQSSRIVRIYYGADETRFNPATADALKLRRELGITPLEPVVGMIAYFYAPFPREYWVPTYLKGRAVKGHETLIQAAKKLSEKKPNVKVLLVGNGWDKDGDEYREHLKETVKNMGLSDTVIFTGYRGDTPDTLASFDVSVQCARSENLGGTIESLLMARPTIATAVGGMTESVIHQQTGLLVPPDDPDKLAEAILELLNNPEGARQLGQNGRQLMLREFTLDKTIDDIDNLYQSSAVKILEQSKPAPLNLHYYRVYRTLMHFCLLIILLPCIADRSMILSGLKNLVRVIVNGAHLTLQKFRLGYLRRWSNG